MHENWKYDFDLQTRETRNIDEQLQTNLHSKFIQKIDRKVDEKNLMNYLESNKIIPANHGEAKENHSTLSAMTILNHCFQKTLDKNKWGIIISTDPGSTYDNLDSKTLLKKMEYYRIQNKELELFDSYLGKRTEFVEIQNNRCNLEN